MWFRRDEGHGSTSSAYLAVALCRLGRFDEAEELATIARATGADDDLATQASARSAQACVRSSRGEHEEALRLAREAVLSTPGTESLAPRGHLTVLSSLTRGRSARGRGGSASAALAAYERKGHEPGMASARASIDEISAS